LAGREFDLAGGSLKTLKPAKGMLIKSSGSIRVIQYVREQARSIRQVALADAGTMHAWISLTDERRLAKDSTLLTAFHPAGRIFEMSL
jgi:hypothetical protein